MISIFFIRQIYNEKKAILYDCGHIFSKFIKSNFVSIS